MILLLSMSCVATAQTFKEGSIRLKGGEEQHGLIGDKRPGAPEGLEFKSGNDSEIKIYYANEIEGYTLDNIFYTAFHTNVYRENDWSFVELMAEGELTLIRRNNMYFIRKKGVVEFTHLSAHYKRQLSQLTRSCPIVSAQALRVSLDRKPVTEFIKAYNECVVLPNADKEGMPRVLSFGVSVGVDYTMAKFRDNVVTRFLSASNQSDKSYVQGGVEVNFKSYRFSKFIGLYTGLLYNSNSYSATNKSTFDPKRPEVNQYSYSYSEVKIPLGFDISRPSRKKASFHIRGGIMMPKAFGLKSNHIFSEVSNDGGKSVYYSEPAQLTGYKPAIMFGGAFGYDFKISNSYLRAQAAYYTGSVQATSVVGGVHTTTSGTLTSSNFMITYIF